MKFKIFTLGVLLSTIAYSQVGIGTSNPDPSSILELNASDKGLLLPRVVLTDVTLATPLASHVQGMVVYNTSATITGYTGNAEGIWRNDGTQWRKGTGAGASGTDLIGQTSGIVSNPTGTGTDETWLGELSGSGASKKQSVLVGYEAGLNNTNGGLTAVGYNAGKDFNNGSGVTIGAFSGAGATNATDLVFVGREAGLNATDASLSTFIGEYAGKDAPKAANSIFIGFNAGANDTVDNTTMDSHSILIGDNTNTSGFKNSVAIGFGAYNKNENEFLIGSYESNPALATQYDIVNPKYPETRDDSGVTTPLNFLYTDGTGKFLSAPVSALGGSSALELYSENPISGTYTSPSAGGNNTVAIGNKASTAIGSLDTTAVGPYSHAGGNYSQAFGTSVNASGLSSTAIGDHSSAAGISSVSLGQGVGAMGNNAITIGSDSQANGQSATAIGNKSTAEKDYTTAVGYNNLAYSSQSTAIGNNNQIPGSSVGTSVGANNFIGGENGTILGNSNTLDPGANNSLAVGMNNTVTVANAYAFGEGNTVSSIKGAIALGANNNVINGQKSIALGVGNTVDGNQGIAIGDSNNVTVGAGLYPFAATFGHANTVNGQLITAIGNNINASQNNTIILGSNASTPVDVGVGTTTPTAKLDVAGDARIQTLPAGAGTDEVITADASGNLRKVSMSSVATSSLLTAVEESIVSTSLSGWTNGTLIPFQVENLDNNGDFDNVTYTFTAPANGLYSINGTIAFEGMTLNTADFYSVTTYMTFTGAASGLNGRYTESIYNNSTNPNSFHIPFDRIVHMDAGDTLTMDLHIGTSVGVFLTSGILQPSSTFLTIHQIK